MQPMAKDRHFNLLHVTREDPPLLDLPSSPTCSRLRGDLVNVALHLTSSG